MKTVTNKVFYRSKDKVSKINEEIEQNVILYNIADYTFEKFTKEKNQFSGNKGCTPQSKFKKFDDYLNDGVLSSEDRRRRRSSDSIDSDDLRFENKFKKNSRVGLGIAGANNFNSGGTGYGF